MRNLIDSMIETMREYGGVGLAAPQVHVPLRIAVIEINANQRYPDAPDHPVTVLVNPRILSASGGETDWEGCLSVPDMRGRVPRAAFVEVEAGDESGQMRKMRFAGFAARAVQHEIDHLEGRVYVDRMADMSSLTFLEEYARYHIPPED